MKQKIGIKIYNETEYNNVLNIEVDVQQKSFVSSTKEIIELHQNETHTTRLLTIHLKERTIGCCLIRINEEHENVFIWQFIIDEKYQNKHYGSDALKQVIDWIYSNENYKTIITTTRSNNAIASKFFIKIGFKVLNEEYSETNLIYVNK